MTPEPRVRSKEIWSMTIRGVLFFLSAQTLSLAITTFAQALKPSYTAHPNHIEILDRALELADSLGFKETGLTSLELRTRLEAGVYSEDYDMIPGVIGEHLPLPWEQGPEFNFYGLLPITKIPYGELTDAHSGWHRGLAHGYDPLNGYLWPGAAGTTIAWANSPGNTFTWDNARLLYEQGKRGEAYECLGHVLHLLMDLSVPAHVKVVNHGTVLSSKRAGTVLDPDIASVIIDEYEMALSGGLELNGVTSLIPDLLGVFRTALTKARPTNVPSFPGWSDYLTNTALATTTLQEVGTYYQGPTAGGEFGQVRDQLGAAVLPAQLGNPTPPVLVGSRWTQMGAYSTARLPGGTAVPQAVLTALCDTLIPRAAEYCAGLILLFRQTVTEVESNNARVRRFELEQNYPNPFNPSTVIRWSTRDAGWVRLAVYDLFGREVTVLVNAVMPAGQHSMLFDARGTGVPVGGIASGTYLYRLTTPGFSVTRKLLLIR
jgi:hypothetical protein